MQHWFSPFRAEVGHTLQTINVSSAPASYIWYTVTWCNILCWPHSDRLWKSSTDDTPVCWGMLWISALITHISAAFQAAFTLVTDAGSLHSTGRFLLPLWHFYTVISRCTLPAFEHTCLVWLCPTPQKTYGSQKPINTIWQSCHRITAYSLSHPTHVCTFFFPVSFMAAMKHWCLCLWFSWGANRDRLD